MPAYFRRRLLGEERDAASRVEDGAIDFVESAEALLVGGRLEFDRGDQLAPQAGLLNDPVLNQLGGIALYQPIQMWVSVQIADDHVVDQQQRRRAQQAARDAVVLADDGVLHGVGNGE